MSKAFRSGFKSGFLDRGTSKMRARDQAYDAMVDQTFNIIPQAMKEKNTIETERKRREAKAVDISNKFGIDVGAAKVFLNEYDIDGKGNTLTLRKLYDQLELQTNEKIVANSNTKPTFVGSPTNINLPTDTSSGFGKIFGKPTLEDAIRGGEDRLGLNRGEGRDALNYINPANLSTDPYRFETSGRYSFVPSPGLDIVAKNDISEIENRIVQKAGGSYDSAKNVVFPNTYVNSQGETINMDTKKYVNSAFAGDTMRLSQDIYANIRGQGQANFSQDTLNYIADSSFLAGSLLNVNRGVIAGAEEGYIDITLGNDPTGFGRDMIEIAQGGLIPYNGFVDLLGKPDANGNFTSSGNFSTEDITYMYKGVKKILKNSIKRPELTITEQRAIELGTLDPEKVMRGSMSIKDAQIDWDTEETLKLDILEKITSSETRNDVVSAVYGAGTYNTIHKDLSDGIAGQSSLGTGEVAENNFVDIVKEAKNNFKGDKNSDAYRGWESMINSMSTQKIQKYLLDENILDTKTLGSLYEQGYVPFAFQVEKGDPDYSAALDARGGFKPKERGNMDIDSYRVYKDGKIYDRNLQEILE